MKRTAFHIISLVFVAMLLCTGAHAQSPRRLLARADSARMGYDFPSAVALCQRAMEEMDSTARQKAEEKLLLAQNGLSMMDFCSQPTVVASRKFSLKDFFLFYPLQNNSWRKLPNQLDSLYSDEFARALYYPEGASDIYYSTADENGIRNIYKTSLKDSLWSAPALINEQLTSSSDEIYPMVSPDGKTLYFASKGLYGMGGYDLYQASWNNETKDWDVPVNMGFPYSSPYDDLLFINTDDGKYSIFASNRDCGKDSICVYVLEFDAIPVRTGISEVKELKALADLQPKNDPSRMDNASAVSSSETDNEGVQRYMEKMKEVRTMRDSLSRFTKNLDALRSQYSSASAEEKGELAAVITNNELLLPGLNATLTKAVKELQAIEMEFLENGIVINTQKLQAQVDKEIVGAASGYTFSKNSYGPSFSLEMQKPKKEFDYSFKVLPEGRFAEDNTLPSGICYQIQIFTQARRASVSDIKGLSPVFEKLNPSGKYTYAAGLFRTYNDALANLNKVKSRGFRDAIIVAFMNGKSISVSNARKMESEVTTSCMVKIYPANGQSLAEGALAAIHELADKDLVKTVEAGSVIYRIGPFDDRSEAQELAAAVKAAGEGNVKIEETEE